MDTTSSAVRFWPRRPRFPILIDTGSELVSARTSAECTRRLSGLQIPSDIKHLAVIDGMAEGFGYYPEQHVISCLVLKRKWSKPEIIKLYHARKPPEAPEYSTKSLGNKRLEQVVAEIVWLLR
jgi:hypothetical protein